MSLPEKKLDNKKVSINVYYAVLVNATIVNRINFDINLTQQ